MPYEVLDEAKPRYEVIEEPKGAPMSRTDKVLTGMADPIHGGAQLLTHILPASVVDSGNALNNWLADKTGLVPKLPAGGVDQQLQDRERDYQAKRAAAGESGFDGYRVIGNVASPANVALAARTPQAAGLLGRMGIGAVSGAATSALNPVTGDGSYADEKLSQIAAGAAFGGLTPAVVSGAARVVSPNASVNPQLQLLRSEGVSPTIGQTLGGAANKAEEKLMSVPLVGDFIANSRRGAVEDMNAAAFNRALAPLQQRIPAGAQGREAVQHVESILKAGYDALLPKLNVTADQQFGNELGRLRQMVSTGAIDPTKAQSFERILQNDVLSKFGQNGSMTGETFKQVESDLGQHIRRLGTSTDADQRLVGDALEEVQGQLRGMLTRSNPNQAKELGTLNSAWANFKRVQKAAASLGAEDGVFSPAQLQSAVKAADRSKDKARFAKGDALMQDLSEAGKAVLGNKVPDSGTAGRMMLGGLSLLDPTMATPALLGGGAALYTRPVQGLLSSAVAARPQAAQPVAQALRQASPALIPLGAQVGLGLLQ